MTRMDPTLLDLVAEASRRKVCWNVHCTTCGAAELRSGIALLARQIPLRLFAEPPQSMDPQLLHPDSSPDAVAPVPWWVLAGRRRGRRSRPEAEYLARVCTDARLDEVAGAAPFPDWLGYLGMILDELDQHEDVRLRIGGEWARQFMAMGGDNSAWARFDREPMSWRDLELAEHQLLGMHEQGGGPAHT